MILASILLRVGIGEAFVRFYFDDDDRARRARTSRARRRRSSLVTTTVALARRRAASPGRCRELILGTRDATLMALAVLGLWAFTNLEIAYALLRVEERAPRVRRSPRRATSLLTVR